ncbi:hypothetical protein [Cellvibrio sp. UBA7671]|uniref:hypothetical protein n=1 Tax=Cellvibrio sp. UBA7671 TaxID=1946312 RepID=UPI002F35AFB8
MKMTKEFEENRSNIDALADKALDSIVAPHALLDISVWHLLTVAEDQVRMIFAGWIEIDEKAFFHIVDGFKYSLKHSITHVYKKSIHEKITLPQKTIPDAYKKAALLLAASEKYESISRLIASTYNQRGTFVKVNDGYKLENSEFVDIRYSVLEGLGHGADPTPDITGVLHYWLTNNSSLEEERLIASSIYDSVRLSKGRVTYYYQGQVAYEVSRRIPQRDKIIPDEFSFSWGKDYKTHALINSLLIRCFYHVLAIEIAARKFGIKGGAESSLLLIVTKQQLCADIQELADFADKEVYEFINMLTYGRNTKTPDIALQPLFLSKSGFFMIPCYQVLNTNIQRNLLTLLAKINPNNFDSQSSLFEKDMTSKIENSLNEWKYKNLNKEFKFGEKKEEIDGFILDEINKTILLMELRWILQPGDAREVYNKIKSVLSKVDQLSRKIDFVKDNFSEIIVRSFGDHIDISQPSEWKVKGVVLIQGYAGTSSPQEDIPIVTVDVFCKGIKQFKDLHAFYVWIKCLIWLPVEGEHFDVEAIIEDNDFVQVSRTVAKVLVNQRQYTESLQKSILDHLAK